jgi:hypothetical protein
MKNEPNENCFSAPCCYQNPPVKLKTKSKDFCCPMCKTTYTQEHLDAYKKLQEIYGNRASC